MFTNSEIEQIIEQLNTMNLYQFVKNLKIDDPELQIEIKNILKDHNSNRKRKNEKHLKYLIKSYLLQKIPPDSLISFYLSLESKFAQELFRNEPIIAPLAEILDNITKFKNIKLEISQKEELNESDKLDNKIEILEQQLSSTESTIRSIYSSMDFFSQKTILTKLLIEESIDILKFLWLYTNNELKKEFLPIVMEHCSVDNDDVSTIYFYKHTPSEIKLEIDNNLTLATLTFNSMKKIIAQTEKENVMLLTKKRLLINFINRFLTIPEQQRQPFYKEFYSIVEKNISKIGLENGYNSLLNIGNFDPVQILQLFQDRLNFENPITLIIDNLSDETIQILNSFTNENHNFLLTINIKSAADLSTKQINALNPNIKINAIYFDDTNLTYWQQQPYTLEQYIACREKIDNILSEIDLTRNPNDPDCEKKIFGKIIRRLANLITYDYALCEKIDNETITEQESFQCASMLGALTVINSEGTGLAVCTGFSETARNIFKCCGIDILVVSGDMKTKKYINGQEEEKLEGHQWNLIKLDGTWYWMDLTWARDDIVAGLIPKYLLKSDLDFQEHLNLYNEGNKLKNMTKYPAPKTVYPDKLHYFLYGNEDRNREMHTITQSTNIQEIQGTICGITSLLSTISIETKGDEYGN